jgi:hypothetical protein
MTSLKAPLGFFADFLESGAQSQTTKGPQKRRSGERESRTSLILWFYEVAITSGLPASDRTNDISNYWLDVLFGVKALDGRLATRVT